MSSGWLRTEEVKSQVHALPAASLLTCSLCNLSALHRTQNKDTGSPNVATPPRVLGNGCIRAKDNLVLSYLALPFSVTDRCYCPHFQNGEPRLRQLNSYWWELGVQLFLKLGQTFSKVTAGHLDVWLSNLGLISETLSFHHCDWGHWKLQVALHLYKSGLDTQDIQPKISGQFWRFVYKSFLFRCLNRI